MTQTLTEPEGADATTAKRAVIYLRVSSSGQVGRENDVEGYSIPAQREACRRKAQSLGAVARARARVRRLRRERPQRRPTTAQSDARRNQGGVASTT